MASRSPCLNLILGRRAAGCGVLAVAGAGAGFGGPVAAAAGVVAEAEAGAVAGSAVEDEAPDGAEEEATVASTSESSVIIPCPTTTVSSSPTRRPVTVPATGLRMSMLTLSVSMTATISSAATASPMPFTISTSVPSVTESPRDGTGTSCAAKPRVALLPKKSCGVRGAAVLRNRSWRGAATAWRVAWSNRLAARSIFRKPSLLFRGGSDRPLDTVFVAQNAKKHVRWYCTCMRARGWEAGNLGGLPGKYCTRIDHISLPDTLTYPVRVNLASVGD